MKVVSSSTICGSGDCLRYIAAATSADTPATAPSFIMPSLRLNVSGATMIVEMAVAPPPIAAEMRPCTQTHGFFSFVINQFGFASLRPTAASNCRYCCSNSNTRLSSSLFDP